MAAEVTLETLEPSPTAVVMATTTWAEFPTLWKPMLDTVWRFLATAPAGLHTHGHNVMLYKDDIPTIEIGVQVNGTFEPSGDVRPSHTPGGVAAHVTHSGPIARLGDAYGALRSWCSANGHALAGPHWEIYGDPDPATGAFDVELFWSVLD